MKYEVGDRVRIKSKEWYDANKGSDGIVSTSMKFVKSMVIFCGKEAVVTDVFNNYYSLNIDDGRYSWDDEMLEDYFLDTPEKLIVSTDLIIDMAEVIKKHNLGVSISENEGKLIIEPLKIKEDLPIDTPCMCSSELDDSLWFLRYYAYKGKVFKEGKKSDNSRGVVDMEYIIPFDKFNPNNIEESLKYNIVK